MTFERDYETLKSVVDDILELRKQIESSDIPAAVEDRGYCLPVEDNWIKRLFSTYKNHRSAVLEIISNRQDYAKRPWDEVAESFLLGFAAATLLFRWSSVLIYTFRERPIIRGKLNEPDCFYGIDENLFDNVYRNLTRVSTQNRLAEAASFFDSHRDQLEAIAESGAHKWLLVQIEINLASITRDSLGILKNRLKRGLDLFGRRSSQPFRELVYLAQSAVFDIFGNIWFEKKPDIPPEHQARFDELAQPGDFFIVRPELKSSTVFLPGWWTHGAVYFGGAEKLKAIQAHKLAAVEAAWDDICRPSIDGVTPVIIEALSAGVVLNPLHASMHVDHAVLLRPRLTEAERLSGLHDVFVNYRKPYDFSFDFSRSDRLVCTELVYRGFDGKGPVRFTPKVRLGHPTLSADDIMEQIQAEYAVGSPAIEIIAMSCRDMKQRHSEFYEAGDALDCLRTLNSTRSE